MRNKWSSFEDMQLSLIVVSHRQQGGTYKEAFQVAKERIGRTAGACRSRWYRVVRSITQEILAKSNHSTSTNQTNLKQDSKVVSLSEKKKALVGA